MRGALVVLLVAAMAVQVFAASSMGVPVLQGSNIETVSSGKLIYKFDLSHGGALYDLSTNCSDFLVKSVGADRGGTQQVTDLHAVLWDIITAGESDRWEGYAADRIATMNILEDNENYTRLEITYTMDSSTPFNGLKVVKIYTIYKDTFYADIEYRLINTGDEPVKLDVSDTWGRASGLMIEMVAKLGADSGDDKQIVVVNRNGTLEYATYTAGSSWSGSKPGAPLTYPGSIELIGIFDNQTGDAAPSPWGFAILLRMMNNTISDTYTVWLEAGTGGAANIVNRIEFAAITLQPGEEHRYYMRLYAGPIYRDTMKKAGFLDVYNVIENPAYPSQPPCSGQALPQNVKTTLNIEFTGPAKFPNAAVKVYQDDTLLYALPINDTQMELGFPSEGRYVLEVSPSSGLTVDGRGRFIFLSWVLPDGSSVTEPRVTVDIRNGDVVTAKFKIVPIVPVYVELVTPDNALLPEQAENITVKIYDSTGQLVFSYTSTADDIASRNVTVKAEGIPGLEPGTYVVELPATAGIYEFRGLKVNGKEVAFSKTGDKVRATFNVPETGVDKIEVAAIYSISGKAAGVSYTTWIIVIAAAIVLGILGFMYQKKKAVSTGPAKPAQPQQGAGGAQ